MALHLIVVGGEHTSVLAAFLNLPFPRKWQRDFNVLEIFLYDSVEKTKEDSQHKAVQEEILQTLNDTNHPVEQNMLEEPLPLHRIQASYDMGWQVRSSGGKYGSPTGHGLLIGAITKKVLDSIVFSKPCAMCTKQNLPLNKHKCVKDYEGTSKSMEAEGLVQLLKRAPEKFSVSICGIISDDDSSGRAKAKHVCKGGKLPIAVEEPRFMADPSHRKRVFARSIYNLASTPVKVSKVNKGLAAHLKYCYGACVKGSHHLPASELSNKVYNILEHICGIHDACNVAWCYELTAKEKNKVCNPPKDHRISKEDLATYQQLKKIFDQYACIDQMAYCNHPFDTQTNESLNTAIALLHPNILATLVQ
jgi:hypothetical protein